MARIDKNELYAALTSAKAVVELQKRSRIDVAAAAMALAEVESAYDLAAQGDKIDGVTNAWGLWQINSRVHKVDTGKVLGDLGYQIELFAGVFAQAEDAVAKSVALIRKRSDGGEKVDYQPARDLPHFYNVAWQYGPGALRQWAASPNAKMDVDGFAAFRKELAKPVEGGYARRASSFRSRYVAVASEAPSFWAEVVAKSGHDVGTIATTGSLEGTALGEVVDEKKKQFLDSLPKLPDPSKWVDELLKIVKLYMVVLALSVVGLVVLVVVFRRQILGWLVAGPAGAAASAAAEGKRS